MSRSAPSMPTTEGITQFRRVVGFQVSQEYYFLSSEEKQKAKGEEPSSELIIGTPPAFSFQAKNILCASVPSALSRAMAQKENCGTKTSIEQLSSSPHYKRLKMRYFQRLSRNAVMQQADGTLSFCQNKAQVHHRSKPIDIFPQPQFGEHASIHWERSSRHRSISDASWDPCPACRVSPWEIARCT